MVNSSVLCAAPSLWVERPRHGGAPCMASLPAFGAQMTTNKRSSNCKWNALHLYPQGEFLHKPSTLATLAMDGHLRLIWIPQEKIEMCFLFKMVNMKMIAEINPKILSLSPVIFVLYLHLHNICIIIFISLLYFHLICSAPITAFQLQSREQKKNCKL